MLKKYVTIGVLITMFSLIVFVGCSSTNYEDQAAYISVNENSSYAEMFKDLSLGILYDFNLKVNNADKTRVSVWVEGYQNGKKTDPFHLTGFGMGPFITEVHEDQLVFGIINPRKEDAAIFVNMAGGSVGPHKISNQLLMNEAAGSSWNYAVGNEYEGLELGETKVIGGYRQVEGGMMTYDFQDPDSIKQMIDEDKLMLLLKMKIEEFIIEEEPNKRNRPH